MLTHNVKPTYESVICSSTDDTTLVMPATKRTRGTDIQGNGKSIYIGGGDLGDQHLNFTGSIDKLLCSNLRADLSDATGDAIDFNATIGYAYFKNCRFDGMNGIQAGIHGDGVQLQHGTIKVLELDGCTFLSAYQVAMLVDGIDVFIMRNCNIRNRADLRKQNSVALEFAFTNTRPIIILENTYIDWTDEQHWMAKPSDLQIIGSLIGGIPPGGDYAP